MTDSTTTTAKSTSLVKRNADDGLMLPPPPPTKRQKRPQHVLDEDRYHDAVSHIVARDFYPGLLESEAQQEYLEALDSNNNDWIRDASKRLTQIMTPGPASRRRMGRGTSFTPRRSTVAGDTPRSFVGDTPVRTLGGGQNNDFAPDDHPDDVDTGMSLGAFQAKYTSEDNESFNALLDKQNHRRAGKYAFFHNGNKITTARQIAYRDREERLLGPGGSLRALITTNAVGEERKVVAALRPSQDLDARSASVDSFPIRQGPRNHFMFGPEGVEDAMMSTAQEAEQRSNAPPKAVSYGATRFQTVTPAAHGSIPPSPSLSAVDAAIAGRPRPTDSEPGYTGADTPRVNGYAFVDAEPTPSELGMPVSEEEADAAEREAAMKLLPTLESGAPNPFTVKERSKREDLHHRLVEKADLARRKESGANRVNQLRHPLPTPGGRTQTPRFSSAPSVRGVGKAAAMTPAAQRLAERIGTPRRKGAIFEDVGESAGGAWMPSPRVSKGRR